MATLAGGGYLALTCDERARHCHVDRDVVPATSQAMYPSRVDPVGARDRARQGFAAARTGVVERLVRNGMPSGTAEPLVDEWLRSTEMLMDFRAAPDFWHLAYQFAQEEYHRRRTARLVFLVGGVADARSGGPGKSSQALSCLWLIRA